MTPVAPNVATQSALDQPVPCFQCGYDLRQHDDTALCPECGTKTYWSLHAPRYLSEFPRRWVATMSRAARLLAFAYATAFVILLSSIAGWLPDNIEGIVIPIITAVAIVQTVGAWQLSQWSGHQIEPQAQWLRWGLRITALAPIALGVLGCVEYFHYYSTLMIWFEMSAAVSATAPVLTFFRMGRVARLISDPALAEHSTIVACGMLITAIALPLALWAAKFLDPGGRRMTDVVIFIIVITALLLFILWASFVMTCCVIDFGRATCVADLQHKPQLPGL